MHDASADLRARWEESAPPLLLGLALLQQALGKAGGVGDSDVWWHLRTGDLILTTRSVPTVDPFSWTAAGETWVPNSWLGDVLFALVRAGTGLAGLSLLRAATVLATGWLLYRLIRREGGEPWPAAVMTAATVLVLNPFVAERPQLFGLVLFPVLTMLLRPALTGSPVAAGLVFMTLAWWANLHGSFIAGVALALAVAARRLPRRPRPALLVGGLAVLGPLLNPYGLDAYRRAVQIPVVSGFIEEWRPLDVTDPRGLLIALLLALSVWAFLHDGAWRRSWWALPFLGFTILTIRSVRTAPFALMVGAIEAAVTLHKMRLGGVREWLRERRRPVLIGVGAGLLVTVILAAPTIGRLGELEPSVPAATTASIPAGCRLLNEYEFGGYVLDRRWPEVLDSQDGRNDLFGLDRLVEQEAMFDRTSLDDLDGIGCVLARPDRPLVAAMAQDPGWVKAAEDPFAVLYVRA